MLAVYCLKKQLGNLMVENFTKRCQVEKKKWKQKPNQTNQQLTPHTLTYNTPNHKIA